MSEKQYTYNAKDIAGFLRKMVEETEPECKERRITLECGATMLDVLTDACRRLGDALDGIPGNSEIVISTDVFLGESILGEIADAKYESEPPETSGSD